VKISNIILAVFAVFELIIVCLLLLKCIFFVKEVHPFLATLQANTLTTKAWDLNYPRLLF